jgi:hypothetical protein
MSKRWIVALVPWLALAGTAAAQQPAPSAPRHFIFFAHERERISEPAFLTNPNIAGAQLKYTWRELEPERDRYDFSRLLSDLAWLEQHGKRLFVQLQDVSFSRSHVVPDYLLNDTAFHGGVAAKHENGAFAGWAARRWDAAVRARFASLLVALGRAADGRLEGVNLAETAIGFGEDTPPARRPPGFTYDGYAAGVRELMSAARTAFARSHVVVFANFMPGEGLPHDDHGYLRGVYAHADSMGVGVGGPDILPYRPWQRRHSLPLIAARRPGTIAAMAVQDGNLAERERATGQRITVAELARFATDTLRLDYIFWGTEEPYYSAEVLPYLRALPRR